MLYLICVVVCAIAVTVVTMVYEGYWELLDTILGAMLGLVIGFVLTAALTVALADTPTTVYEYSTTNLIALNDGTGKTVNGTFFLGTGHVSTSDDLEYRFIYRTEKGMTVGERRAMSVYLEYIEEDEAPRLVKYAKRYDDEFYDWLLGTVDYWEVFYVPEGSITNDIIIDLT